MTLEEVPLKTSKNLGKDYTRKQANAFSTPKLFKLLTMFTWILIWRYKAPILAVWAVTVTIMYNIPQWRDFIGAIFNI